MRGTEGHDGHAACALHFIQRAIGQRIMRRIDLGPAARAKISIEMPLPTPRAVISPSGVTAAIDSFRASN